MSNTANHTTEATRRREVPNMATDVRQAIITKYLGPTDTKGSRFKAPCSAGSVTVSYDYSLGSTENHQAAAQALCEKLGWTTDRAPGFQHMVSGGLPDGSYCHVFVPASFTQSN